MARRYDEFTGAGAIVASVSVDSVGQNAAMVDKLQLPFPLLSDPDRSVAVGPYGVADPVDAREIALPTTVVIDPAGAEVWRRSSTDFADRPEEDLTLEVVNALDLPATTAPAVKRGRPEPGPKAMPFDALTAYYRGAKFAAIAMGRRFPDARDTSMAYAAQMDRYVEAVHQTRDLR